MSVSDKQICRLCLKITPACECETIEETRKEILKILLINIDFDISDYAVACNRCMETLQNCFNFRSHTTFVGVDMKVDIKKVFHKEMASNEDICCLCMSSIEDGALKDGIDWKGEVFLPDMIRHCLPEVDLSTNHEPLICKRCLGSTKEYYEFIKTCREVEQRIQNYCRAVAGSGIIGKVVLEDVLEFKNCDTVVPPIVIKTECSNEADANVMLVVPKQEPLGDIKCEEVDIKDELDNGMEMIQSDQLEDYERCGRNTSSSRFVSKEKKQPMYGCPRCPYSSNRSNNIKTHVLTHSKKMQKCFLCPFITDAKLLMKEHMTNHRGSTKAFSCSKCPYETDQKHRLVQHFVKHKDTSEVEMHKCPLCPYQTKYKAAAMKHQKLLHEENVNMYNCEKCSFSTKHIRSLLRHQLRHKNPQEIPKHKCEKCKFETMHKFNLAQHMITHEDPEVANKFKCEKCLYRGKRQQDLKRHMMVHSEKHPSRVDTIESGQSRDCNSSSSSDSSKEMTEVKASAPKEETQSMYFCPKCSYSSNRKNNIKLHNMRVHLDNKVRKCYLCPFIADTMLMLKAHMTSHKGANKAFGCRECPYETDHKRDLVRHILKHKDKSEVEMHKCPLCPYETKYKPGLAKHRKLQHDKNIKIYKCNKHKCEFETKYKESLVMHLLNYEDYKAANKFKNAHDGSLT